MALETSPASGFLITRWWLSTQKIGRAPTQGRSSEEGEAESLLGEVLWKLHLTWSEGFVAVVALWLPIPKRRPVQAATGTGLGVAKLRGRTHS